MEIDPADENRPSDEGLRAGGRARREGEGLGSLLYKLSIRGGDER